jgi:ubiquinone/menaquinone biosynthesis C-methylase UbiE
MIIDNEPSESKKKFIKSHIDLWNSIGKNYARWSKTGKAYHKYLEHIYKAQIPSGSTILEIGCGRGDLLASLKPSLGVGVDFSSELIKLARETHPELTFVESDIEVYNTDVTFDFIILSDTLNDTWDVHFLFEKISRWCNPKTRIIINEYSRLWEPSIDMAASLGLAKPHLQQNWLTITDLENLLNIGGFEVIRTFHEFIFPLNIPGLTWFFNRYVGRIFPFNLFDLSNFIIARKRMTPGDVKAPPIVSVIVPARNEAGNIARLLARIPEMGGGTEIIFIEGHSSDNTYETIEEQMKLNPKRNCKLFQQPGKGKGDAVRYGFSKASGEIFMILDADISVPPENLESFYNVLINGHGDFVNGVRMVYPMEKEAMRFANLIGNKFFSLAFSALLGQPVKDTLCGTKVLWKSDYERIVANRAFFGDFDPFGDFDLLFGAAHLNLKIVDLPVRYLERTYGTTNISRWKHGFLLLRMWAFALNKLKFY